jgi:hypothetical protein
MKLEITSDRGIYAASTSMPIDRSNLPNTTVCAPLRHRAVVRARRHRRGFGGPVTNLKSEI